MNASRERRAPPVRIGGIRPVRSTGRSRVESVREVVPRASWAGSDEVDRLASPSAGPDASVEWAQHLAHLQRARDDLPEPDATIIRLHYDGGMPLAQVARTLGLTLGRVRHVHARGIAHLGDAMHRAVGGDEES